MAGMDLFGGAIGTSPPRSASLRAMARRLFDSRQRPARPAKRAAVGFAAAARPMSRIARCLVCALLALPIAARPADAADLTVRQVVERLVRAADGPPADFSGMDLSFLDLSGLDFRAANLAGTDLYGTDLSRSSFAGANLSRARLDRSIIIATDFTGADLSGALLRRPAAFTTFEVVAAEAPIFVRANLSGAAIFGKLSQADFSDANLAGARMGAYRDAQLINLSRMELVDCDFSGADLTGADLSQARLAFADLTGADLTAANLSGADLSRADLTGATLTGTQLAGADLDGAVLTDARGLDRALGLDAARNRGTVVD
jgi:uncharacterized protein YjbI with pentapeptide repeats